jgi:predicted dehydrogenase
VLVEKPMAMNAVEGAEIEAAAESAGVVCMPGYSFRFSMGSYLKRFLDLGVVGEIQSITGSFGIPPMNAGWRSTPETGGGPLLFVGCHLIDFVLWLTGEDVVSVAADIRRRSDTGADDTAVIQLRLKGGGLASLHVSQAAAALDYGLQINGRSGTVALRGRSLAHFELEVTSKSVAAHPEPTTIRPTVFRDHISTMLVPELEEFAQACRSN